MTQHYTVTPKLLQLAKEIAVIAYADAAVGNNPRIVKNNIDGQIYMSFRKDCCKYDMNTALSSQLTLH